MTQEFDFHASIKWLAEAEQECPRQVPGTVGSGYHDGPGDGCEFTGRIVPFASLRIRYDGNWFDHSLCPVDDYEPCAGIIVSCGGRGWIPEPDVEKACWRVHISHPYTCYAATIEEELRAAEAWLKERDA